ncbi:PAS domain-containing protein [Cellulomonas bogoriensis]|uniref:Aerotaxis receptor Aer n=1 Tax=Cellulomonas bogoriensis 69B4 = DSM 16987 TaxID=1386082 RepID=A0A0A0BYE7_9CELL|nr:PAS domain-containing protein [Cellulomonas bogoriensis]KGM12995.1 aerotaxis receptor Aer [Cellulomonas bogoriensis 69B4 = DSM 16987]
MRRPAIEPTGVERTVSPDSVIVSKTDPKGRITYVNHTFLEISRYREDEVIGRAHSIVRHPDMPRAVFELMWRTIGQGQEIFAYVNNLAADGAHYWVLAHVTPSTDRRGRTTGYHSNRRHADRRALQVISPLYDHLRGLERAAASTRDGLDASRAALATTLQERDQSYDEFVWATISDGES